MESFETKGHWWIPTKASRKLFGDLVYNENAGAKLALSGTFSDSPNDVPETYEVILGISAQGKLITLVNSVPLNLTWNFFSKNLGSSTYHSHLIFEGVHFKNKKQIKFHELRASYSDLDAWVNKSGFRISESPIRGRATRRQAITFSLPKSRAVKLSKKLTAGVAFHRNGPTWNAVQVEAKITQQAFFVIRNTQKTDTSYFELKEKVSSLAELLQLASQRLATPKEIIGYTKKNRELIGKKRTPYYPPVKIYYQPIEVPGNLKAIYPNDFLFLFKDLTDKQIANWFSAYGRYQTQIHLYRTLRYSSRSFAETKFLNIVQALEALHSKLYTAHQLDPKIFKQRRDEAIASVPPKLKEWLHETIGSNNFKPLKSKLAELLEKKRPLFSEIVSDHNTFAYRVRQTRNQLIHQGLHQRSFEQGKELHCATLLLVYLFEAYLLQLIGFTPAKIKTIYKRRIIDYKSWGILF